MINRLPLVILVSAAILLSANITSASEKPEIFVQMGHTRNVNSVAFSHDGRSVLSGSDDNTLKLWNVSTGKEIRTFAGHAVSSVTFSSDGRYVLSGGYDKTIKLWDIATGKLMRTFSLPPDWQGPRVVLGAVFSSDGRYALVSFIGEIKIWNIATGEEIKSKDKYSSGIPVYTAKGGVNLFTPDGKYAVDIGMETLSPSGRYKLVGSFRIGTVKLSDTATSKVVKTFSGHTNRIHSVTFSPNERYALSGSYDGTTRLWDVNTGKEIAQFISFTDGEWIVITPEGYFNASPNGAKHLNVRIGNNVYSIDNFYEKFFNPVYVASVLQGKKVEAVADIRKGFLTPPDVKIISPEPNATFNADTITITVSAKTGQSQIPMN